MTKPTRHPAKFSDALLDVMEVKLQGARRILDPFAGTSKLKRIRVPGQVVCLELEPEWAVQGADVIGNALQLPFAAWSFDAVATSPCYGNRMADHHEAKDSSRRNTYRHALGRPLHPANAGQLQWGQAYWDFHWLAWGEVWRVLEPGGMFLLNVSNHIRAGKEINAVGWHRDCMLELGFGHLTETHVVTPRLRYGANHSQRVEYEAILIGWKV